MTKTRATSNAVTYYCMKSIDHESVEDLQYSLSTASWQELIWWSESNITN